MQPSRSGNAIAWLQIAKPAVYNEEAEFETQKFRCLIIKIPGGTTGQHTQQLCYSPCCDVRVVTALNVNVASSSATAYRACDCYFPLNLVCDRIGGLLVELS